MSSPRTSKTVFGTLCFARVPRTVFEVLRLDIPQGPEENRGTLAHRHSHYPLILRNNTRFIFLISEAAECNSTYFKCGKQCIPLLWLCDGNSECEDGNDEANELCFKAGKCGGNYSSSAGLLTSPMYPAHYPHEANCTYTITQPSETYVEIILMHIELDSRRNDCLEIRDGDSAKAPLMAKLCNGPIPLSIQSTQNLIWMRYNSSLFIKVKPLIPEI